MRLEEREGLRAAIDRRRREVLAERPEPVEPNERLQHERLKRLVAQEQSKLDRTRLRLAEANQELERLRREIVAETGRLAELRKEPTPEPEHCVWCGRPGQRACYEHADLGC